MGLKTPYTVLCSLQHKSGLFSASNKNSSTGYHRAWIRDNVYVAIGLEKVNIKKAVKTYRALLDILLKHEYKIDWAIKVKPDAKYKYVHARYDPNTLEEIPDEWGNKQNDAIGILLFKIGELEKKGVSVLRNINDYRILQKLVFYLNTIEYWHDPDNGIWEENEEVHASSVGACLAGLNMVKELLYVPNHMLVNGLDTLNMLLPKESLSKDVDLALLSLIYPFNIVSDSQKQEILNNVTQKLVRTNGVIRYPKDKYYETEAGEAEWVFGLLWLAIIHKINNDLTQYEYYLGKVNKIMVDQKIPELYYSCSLEHNENCPLAWAQAMYLVARTI